MTYFLLVISFVSEVLLGSFRVVFFLYSCAAFSFPSRSIRTRGMNSVPSGFTVNSNTSSSPFGNGQLVSVPAFVHCVFIAMRSVVGFHEAFGGGFPILQLWALGVPAGLTFFDSSSITQGYVNELIRMYFPVETSGGGSWSHMCYVCSVLVRFPRTSYSWCPPALYFLLGNRLCGLF